MRRRDVLPVCPDDSGDDAPEVRRSPTQSTMVGLRRVGGVSLRDVYRVLVVALGFSSRETGRVVVPLLASEGGWPFFLDVVCRRYLSVLP